MVLQRVAGDPDQPAVDLSPLPVVDKIIINIICEFVFQFYKKERVVIVRQFRAKKLPACNTLAVLVLLCDGDILEESLLKPKASLLRMENSGRNFS